MSTGEVIEPTGAVNVIKRERGVRGMLVHTQTHTCRVWVGNG